MFNFPKQQISRLLSLFVIITLILIATLFYSHVGNVNSDYFRGKRSFLIDSVRSRAIDSLQRITQYQTIEVAPNKPILPIELYDLINKFTPNRTVDYDLFEWKTEANNTSINWLTHGVEMGEHEFYREGETVVSVNGKVIECLDRNSYPCKWGFALFGVRGGYTSFEISSVQSQALEEMSLNELFKNNKFEAKILKTDELNNKTYLVKFPHKKSIKMTVNWSCGSAGCSLNVKCNTEL